MWKEISADDVGALQRHCDIYNEFLVKFKLMSEGTAINAISLQRSLASPMTDVYYFNDGEVELVAFSRYKSDIDRIEVLWIISKYLTIKQTYNQERNTLHFIEYYKLLMKKYNKGIKARKLCSNVTTDNDFLEKYGNTASRVRATHEAEGLIVSEFEDYWEFDL